MGVLHRCASGCWEQDEKRQDVIFTLIFLTCARFHQFPRQKKLIGKPTHLARDQRHPFCHWPRHTPASHLGLSSFPPCHLRLATCNAPSKLNSTRHPLETSQRDESSHEHEPITEDQIHKNN